MTMAVISSVFDFLKALPSEWTEAIGAQGLIDFLDANLPFFSQGFGWVMPTLAGVLIGVIIDKFRKK